MEEDLSELLKIYGVGSAPYRKAVHPGSLGQPIQLLSNLYNVTMQNPKLHRYDVTITKLDGRQSTGFSQTAKKNVTSTKVNHRALIQFSRDGHLGSCIPAYDGKSILYLTQKLDESKTSGVVSVNMDDDADCDEFARKARFEVTLKDAGPLSLKTFNAEVVQALDIIVRTGPLITPGIVPVGRSFFTQKHPAGPGGEVALRGCRELWFGYFCSIRPGQWKPMLNVNLSATLFHESLPLIDYVCKFFNKNSPEDLKKGLKGTEHDMLNRELQGVKITVTHLPYKRKYKVAGISKKGPTEYSFNVNGTRCSVAEYFEKHYGIQLQYPGLQCVETMGKDGNKNYLPMEVCETIEGQHAKMVTSDQTAVLIRKTALSPTDRFKNIDTFVRKVIHEDAAAHLQEFGLQVDLRPVAVRGRVLNAPDLEVGKKNIIKPREGYWRMDRRQFFAGAELLVWGVADCHGSRRTAEFAKNIERLGNNLGMKISPPAFVKTFQRVPVKSMLTDIKTEFPQIVMTIVIMGRETEYELVKQLSENDESLLMITQCIRGTTLESKKNDNNFMVNVLMKINAKLGGTNNTLTRVPACMQEPFIVFGADVSHPGPMNKLQPSIAAVVGSLDQTPSQYHTVTSFQRSNTCNRLEYIANLKVMIKDCLRAFYRRNHAKPMTLLFFRDGVSDSQFEPVRAFEILQIRMACKELEDDYEPPLTFIVVQKRHQVRFKPTNEAEGQGRHKNIPAGTVIEDTVTHPVNFDYFLCSHAGIQGTSKPAHYQVLHDDANRSADELQAISYNLCHVYGRCARSVSIPAPVYYAHLAAARAKDHFKAANIHPSSNSDGSSGIESGSSLLQREIGSNVDLYDLKRLSSNVDARMRDFLYYI